jgi:hypothetical protein
MPHDWEPGQDGLGIVSHDGSVHTWDADEYPSHARWLKHNPNAQDGHHFEIEPSGRINLLGGYGEEDHPYWQEMAQRIMDVDDHLHWPDGHQTWDF